MARAALVLVVLGFGLIPGAKAQFDASRFADQLRAKYAPLLTDGSFTAAEAPGIDMNVVFAANGHVCRIQLKPHQDGDAGESVDRFLNRLLPATVRGLALRTFSEAIGLPSKSTRQYENLTISESFQGEEWTDVTVSFPKEVCPAP